MNSYLYYGILGLIVVLGAMNASTFYAGTLASGIWAGALIIMSAALAQYDARKDCQREIDDVVKRMDKILEKKYELDKKTKDEKI